MSRIPDICSMYILLAAATPFEIQPAIDFLTKSPSRPVHLEAQHLITGIGSVSTAWSLMHHIGHHRPALIIQAGIAGCFTGKKPGEVVAVKEEILADLGVWEGDRFKDIFDLNLAGKDGFPFSNRLLMNPYDHLLKMSGLESVRSITVNEITTDQNRIAWYQQNILPVVESMEGGALHYVCLQENIPFLQLRSVSNYIGERDKTKWDIPAALHNLNEQLISMLQKLDGSNNNILTKDNM
jgi:futalosine hydrolase